MGETNFENFASYVRKVAMVSAKRRGEAQISAQEGDKEEGSVVPFSEEIV
jgi:hypothetical protein